MPLQQLTEQQLKFFNTFGFLHLKGWLDAEIEQITAGFERVFGEHGGGHHGQQHSGDARSCIVPFIDKDAFLRTLLDNPRIEGLAADLLGDDFNYMSSDGNYYVGDTNWHSDGRFDAQHRFVKFAFYLDPLTADTGALRVIPGSNRHTDTFSQDLSALHQCEANLGIDPRDVPCVIVETQPGDLIVFHHPLKHASFGGSTRRRMFTMNLAARHADENLGQLRDYIAAHKRFWIDSLYDEPMINTGPASRMRHLEQVLANQSHLPALTAAARAEMAEPSRG